METITLATPEDVPALADLLAILFAQEADFTPDRTKQEEGLRLIVRSPEVGVIFVARVDSTVVGMVSLLFTVSTAQGGRVCWLEDMVVHPTKRASGLGSHLMEHAIDYARSHGYGRISLLTDRVNDRAIRFYERHGFVESKMTVLRRYL
jgi:GNAT superfamily N-acetyltransferase